ncbi:exopolysaccharide biosynthesis polyprenyl glycosylphosphotransferase, partial [Methylobrevis pamukkalensis]|uniref:exopolysaccharide biosynthesis polyprenyl glycosylphosphotransferase n=1 Tax=Methylobrevis pamukkalensis TaxID=1439726 RepID=UPI000845C47F
MSFRQESIPASIVSGMAVMLDFSLLVLFGAATLLPWVPDLEGLTAGYAGPAIGAPILMILAGQIASNYDIAALRRPALRTGQALVALGIVVGLFLAFMFVGGIGFEVSRAWLGLWLGAEALALVLASSLAGWQVRRWTRQGKLKQRAVIVGGGAPAEALIRAVERDGGKELEILGIFDDRADERSPENVSGYPKLGNIGELEIFARLAAVDLLIVSMPLTAEHRILQLLKNLWVLPVDIRLSAHASKLRLRPRAYSYIGGVPFLDVFDKPIAGWDRIAKRIFDVIFASLALVVLSPLMLATAVAVRAESRGPVIFRQKRYGFNNEVIEVMKFRSMFHEMADPSAAKVVTKGDARVTKVGRFIRRTSIDELPQLVNVLRGELSLIGPRPHAVNAHTEQKLWEEVVDGYFARHKVKPGVTGWAQINGLRGEIDRPEKIQARASTTSTISTT